jgi:hypothetical protein
MPTTALLVEIVIVGFGFFITVLPIISLLFNVDPKIVMDFYNKIPIQFQLTAAYAAGVMWNRICDQIFSKFDDFSINSKFSTKSIFQKARIEVVLEGVSIRDYIGNFRSLIRVSRGLTVLMLVYFLSTILIALFRPNLLYGRTGWQIIPIIFLEGVFLGISFYSWLRLSIGYVAAVYDAYSIIKSKRKSNK